MCRQNNQQTEETELSVAKPRTHFLAIPFQMKDFVFIMKTPFGKLSLLVQPDDGPSSDSLFS